MRSLTLNNAVANIEDTFRTDRNITPTTLGGAALKKLAVGDNVFKYQQRLRLKRKVALIVDGDPE